MTNNKLQYFTSGLAFLLSSQVLFSPVYESRHKIFVCVAILIFAPIAALVYSKIYSCFKNQNVKGSLWHLFLCIPASVFLCFCAAFCLFRFTDGLSPYSEFYSSSGYVICLVAVLSVIVGICVHGGGNGFYRFCSLTALLFVLYFLIMYLGLLSVDGVISPKSIDFGKLSVQGLDDWVFAFILLFSDVSVFLFIFGDKENGHKQNLYVVLFAVFILLSSVFRTSLMLGSDFSALSVGCDLISIKLIPGFDFPEICILVTGFASVIKASAYLYAAQKLILLCFPEKAVNARTISGSTISLVFIFCLLLSGKVLPILTEVKFFGTILFLSSLFPIFILSFVSKRKK